MRRPFTSHISKEIQQSIINLKPTQNAKEPKKIHYSDSVLVYPQGGREPILAMVNRKAVAADPNTRTFSLELLARNKVVNVEQNIYKEYLKLPQIKKELAASGQPDELTSLEQVFALIQTIV